MYMYQCIKALKLYAIKLFTVPLFYNQIGI